MEAETTYARTCFVIMPYGRRQVGKKKPIDFDRIYENIFRPAIRHVRVNGKSLIALRADKPSHSRILIHRMVQAILRSRLVLAEVSTPNRNVWWELGVRHGAVRSGTVLLRLKGMTFRLTSPR